MSDLYTGHKTFEVDSELVEKLHKTNQIECWDKRFAFYPNMYVELRSNNKQTALGRVSKDATFIQKISPKETSDLKPRNREQIFAVDALMDDDIPIVCLTGSAGTGKTLVTLAIMLQKLWEKKYEKMIITRPMSQVGRYALGSLPGDASEKFHPYLLNYTTNLEQFGGGKNGMDYLLEQGKVEALPMQLFRGASFSKCIVIADETQVLNHHEMLTIGSRMGEGSKLIVLGDLNQRDENIAKDKTGIFKMMNSQKMKESHLVAAVELQKCERSETARLFSLVFEEK